MTDNTTKPESASGPALETEGAPAAAALPPTASASASASHGYASASASSSSAPASVSAGEEAAVSFVMVADTLRAAAATLDGAADALRYRAEVEDDNMLFLIVDVIEAQAGILKRMPETLRGHI